MKLIAPDEEVCEEAFRATLPMILEVSKHTEATFVTEKLDGAPGIHTSGASLLARGADGKWGHPRDAGLQGG